MKNKIIKSAIALSIAASAAFAQAPSPIPMGSWLGFPPAGVVPAGSLGSTYFFSQHKVTNMGAQSNQTQKFNIVAATLRTGFNDGWGMRVSFPIAHIKNETTDSMVSDRLGNVSVYIEKDILNQRAGDPITLSLDLGAGVPSAENNNGWGLKTALRSSYRNGPHIVHGGLFYDTWKRGPNGYKEGDSFQATAVYTYAINHTFDVFGGFSYTKQKNHTNHAATGFAPSIYGGNDVMYGNVGFAVKTKVATVSFGVGLPVVDKFKGATVNGNYARGNEEAKSKVKYGMFVILPLIKPKQN